MMMLRLVGGLVALLFAGYLLFSGGEDKPQFDYPITDYTVSSTTTTTTSLKPMQGSTADLTQDMLACEEFEGADPNVIREEFYYLDPEECP